MIHRCRRKRNHNDIGDVVVLGEDGLDLGASFDGVF
jgi:hypothetical protein